MKIKISPDYIKNKPSLSDSTEYYNSGGRVSQKMKVWCDTFTPSTGNGHSVSISSAGFANIVSVNAIAIKNTGTSTSVPNVAIKSYSTTSVTLNIIEGNASLVNLLGSNVLLGPSTAFANTSGLKVCVTVTGY